jgi:transglutaminase-like putative cysteine protease
VRYDFVHSIKYSYSKPVFLEPQTIRLRPRCDFWQNILAFTLRVNPQPTGLAECVDLDGTSCSLIWFDGLHEALAIETSFSVETRHTNPFDYVLNSDAQVLPMRYGEDFGGILAPYLTVGAVSPEVSALADRIGRETGWETTAFLRTLTSTVMETISPIVRPEGEPQPPLVTLTQGQGACRDYTVLFLEVCRIVGLAGRFVSGYFGGEPENGERQLHAWAEIYLPNAGWRGYDPMYGLAVADQHIPVAAAATPSLAAPTTGTFRGTDASSTMTTGIHMSVRETNC